MEILQTLLILTTIAAAPNGSESPPEVFHCTFDQSWDQNYDGWPDGWSRRRGKGYPEYISVKIVPAGDGLSDGRCLQVDLDGGAAVTYTPPLRVTPLHSYTLRGVIDTSGLKFDRASLSLTLLDDKNERLETYSSDAVGPLPGWTTVTLGPIEPKNDSVRFAVLGLQVQPGEQADLTGRVRFGEIRLTRLPRITLGMGNSHHLFSDPGEMTVDCRVSGITRSSQRVRLILEDALGNRLAEAEESLETSTAPGSYSLASDDQEKAEPTLV
ncbi:MAG: hypothetical protein ACYC6Y_21250, partial [Thermoguttaceae bacterium]